MRRVGRALALAGMVIMAAGPAAMGWTPVGGGDKPKLEVETRFMFWGVDAGKDAVPAGTPAQMEDVQDFYLRRGRLLARYRPTDKLELYFQAGQDNWGSKVSTDETGLRIKDFFVNWNARDSFQATAGQFKIPFLRNNLESGFNQLLVDRPAVASVRPAREGSRDLGVMAWGNAGPVQYRAALFDGSDQEDISTGSSPRGSGRVSWNWGARETGLGYTGTTIGQQKLLQIAVQGDVQSDRADPADAVGFTTALRDYGAWAVDLFLDLPFAKRWAVTGEGAWIERHDDYQDPTLADRDLDGFYVQAGVLLRFQPKGTRFQLAARFEDLDTSRSTGRTSSTGKTVGLNWFLRGHDQKLQFDYTHRTDSPVEIDNDLVRASVVMVF
jgi:hypothetical protein